MKLISFMREGRAGFGRTDGILVTDYRGKVEAASLREFLARGEAHPAESADCALADVELLPPIPDPRKIMCVGLNYRSHVAEAGHAIPEKPTIFFRMANSQVGQGAALVRPRISEQFDFEGEMALVIGTPARHVRREDALAHVAGYSCYNDASVRDWQRHSSQWGPGKNFARSGAFGPWLVTADEIPDPSRLELVTRLNGTEMQRATTDDLIFDVPALIAYCSTFTELEPGDVIVTGTTGGVGGARTPPVWMKAGDRVEIDISSIGTLSNPVCDEAQG